MQPVTIRVQAVLYVVFVDTDVELLSQLLGSFPRLYLHEQELQVVLVRFMSERGV